jgi:hypothetical protein
MIAALKSEYRKLFSTRMWWVLMLCAVGLVMPIAVLMAFLFTADFMPGSDMFADAEITDSGGWATMAYSIGLTMPYIFPLLIGALSITQEYRHKTITPTFLAEPRRGVVLGAKLIAAVPMGVAYGIAALAAVVAPVAAVFALRGEPTDLASGDTWALFGRSLLALAVWAVVGVGVGALIHNQVAAIVGVLVVTQIIEPLLQMLPTFTNFGSIVNGGDDPVTWEVLKYLPSAAGGAIQGASNSIDSAASAALPWGWATLVLLAWAALFAGVGYLTTWRRDVS